MEQNSAKNKWVLPLFAWVSMLTASSVAIIILKELGRFGLQYPSWYPWIHVALLGCIFVATLLIKILHPLRMYVLILLILFLLGFGGGWEWGLIPYIRGTTFWMDWETNGPWVWTTISIHSLRLVPALVILIVLLIAGNKPRDFFLVLGDIRADIEPTMIIGLKKPEPWPKIGIIFTAIFTLGTLIFLIIYSIINNSISWAQIQTNWYYLPIALLIAATNAFNEEFSLRAAPLSRLHGSLGKTQALLLTSIFFGIGHYYGVPNGILGVLLSTFLGWFVGKSLLETKGFFWAWILHFFPDVIIFSFYALIA